MNPITPRVLAIVRREYLQRVRSRWFLLSTLGLPLLLVALSFLSVWFVQRQAGDFEGYRTAIVDRDGALADLVAEELERDSVPTTLAPELAALPDDSLPSRLLASAFDIYLLLPEKLMEGEGAVRILGRENVGSQARRGMERAVQRAVVRGRLRKAGLENVDTRALLDQPSVEVVAVFEEGARSQETFQAISFVIAIIFYMVLLVYGQMIVRSVIEEKASDIVEIIVSSVRPWELMLGKIIGVGAVGVTQMAIWAVVMLGLTVYGLTGGAVALAEAGVDLRSVSIPLGTVIGALTFLILGYLLYAGLFAGAGATISTEQDAQQVTLPVTFLIIIPFLMAQGVIEQPDTSTSILLSIVPFFSPLLMPSRLMVTHVAPWEIASAVILLVASILGVAWIAGRIYRVGILLKGKRPNVPELIRWIRHG
ncbi:MAG: ABC transporter permease [Gemmatimonadota bacterium]